MYVSMYVVVVSTELLKLQANLSYEGYTTNPFLGHDLMKRG